MLYQAKIDQLMGATASLYPDYVINGVDVNEALDYGVANCAIRTYTMGALVIDQLPSRFVEVKFGYTIDEHGLIGGRRIYGHTALELWVAEERNVIDSDERSQVFVDQSTGGQGLTWYDLDEGYRRYLDELDRHDVRFNRTEVTRVAKAKAGIK